MIPRIAFAALALAVLTSSTAHAQRFGSRFRGNNNRPTQRLFQQQGRGPIMQRIYDFGTVYGTAQRRGIGGLPMRDSAINSIRTPILSWGTDSDRIPTSRTTLSRESNMRPARSFAPNGMEFTPQTRAIPNAAPWVAPPLPYHGGLIP